LIVPLAPRINLISPALPPKLNGIGDYTARLAECLARSAVRVKVLAGVGPQSEPIPGVEITHSFSPQQRRSVYDVADAIINDRPDWVILQFQQFAYGRWGLNPFLPRAMERVRRFCPRTRLAVMFHEDFVPPINWKFVIMRIWQRWQFRALGRLADAVLFSIDPWVRRYRSWFPDKPVIHLPVGSNIPRVAIGLRQAKARLGIGDDCVVLGVFGAIHASRNIPWLQAAINTAERSGREAVLLYIGPDASRARELVAHIPVIAEGPLPPDEVSRRLAAVDVYLAPFSDGVSTRRGSMMAGLQHGLATVGTRGELTDAMLGAEDGKALLLSDVGSVDAFARNVITLLADAHLRRRLGAAAQALYQREFAWPRIADRLLSALNRFDLSRATNGDLPSCSTTTGGAEMA
jgi:glycosyltransferase involved in cell wall biosynthesis